MKNLTNLRNIEESMTETRCHIFVFPHILWMNTMISNHGGNKMLVKVRNVTGSGMNARQISGSWLQYWESKMNRKATRCLAHDYYMFGNTSIPIQCGNQSNLVGGHVQIVDQNDGRWYILPICSSHNQKDGYFYAQDSDLVWARE